MAQKSGFFNAKMVAGVYDRTYTADDYCDCLAVIISNGVLRSVNDDLKVNASGLNLTVNAGWAWINGHYYHNDTEYSLPPISTPTGGSRIDRVVLRFNNSIPVRSISLQYLTGTASTSPVPPDITRTGNIYDLCLAEITVNANSTTASVKDTRSDADLCGWVYSVSGDGSFFTSFDNAFTEWFEGVKDTLASVTLFKRYKWQTTLENPANTIQFSIPQYDPDTCFIEVICNGLLADNYTQNGNVLTFSKTLIAGTEIIVFAYKSIDGTGIMSVSEEITELQDQYATLDGVSKYVYMATGVDDNISLSQIAAALYSGSYSSDNVTAAANAFLTALGGNTYLSGLADDSKITVEVVGTLGATTPVYGTGTAQNRYRYFNLGQTATSSKRIIFDFAKADKINIDCANSTNNIIFYGTDLELRNVSVKAMNSGTDCNIQMIVNSNIGKMSFEDCSFEINTTGDAIIAENGTFLNCYAWAASSGGNSLLFVPNSNEFIRVIGGTFFAYEKASGKTAAIFYTYGTETSAVIIAQNINCPTVTLSGYLQQYLSVCYAGKTFIDFVVSTLNSTGSYNTITNQVLQSKA